MTDEPDPIDVLCQGRLGTMLGAKWRLDALIGVGGMAAVYAGTHRNGARAAIKVLHAEYAGHAEVRARFLREAYIANKVGHAGSVKVLDDDVSESGEPYLVMELLVGESVETRARRNGGWLRYQDVLDIVDQTLAVLEQAHAVGVVHRDLKPDNLFLTAKGELKVLDFGIARLREADSSNKRTQTGMVMGTPSYMPPEQALGRWEQVDGRTDLWSVGAIFFSLLAGRSVHEGQTDNEVFIRAATRPAPSLARVVPKAPIDVVRVVDKALQFEQQNRFADATSMRTAVRSLMAAAGVTPWGGPGAAPQAPPAAPQAPPPTRSQVAPVHAGPPPAAVSVVREVTEPASPDPRTGTRTAPAQKAQQRRVVAAEAVYDADFASDEDLGRMKELFTEIERALIAKSQYGSAHPEARRRMERAFRVAASGLSQADTGLVWNVTPYAFVARDTMVWEPQAPLDRVPYQLFADGIRVLGLLENLKEDELQEFLRLITLDRATEVAPEDDLSTLLWDATFEHVVYQVVDTFADGDQNERLKFEVDRDAIVQFARADTSEELSTSWQERHARPAPTDMAEHQTRLLSALSVGPVDAESAARAQDLRLAARAEAPDPAAVLTVDDALRTMLAARLGMGLRGLSERFAFAAARACEAATDSEGVAAVTTPLRYAIDGLALEQPHLAIDMVGALCDEIGRFSPGEERERVRAVVTGNVVSPKMMSNALGGAKSVGAQGDAYAKGLRMILGYCDATYFDVVLGQLDGIKEGDLRDVLIGYLARHGVGREADLAKLFETADLELGLSVLRILANINSNGAREAIAQAARSPHAVVRIEALGHLEGVSSERLRLELRGLLEDKEPGVRLAALRAMERYGIRVAGPFLALRVRSEAFDALSVEERRQALQTVFALAPSRAEGIALEVAKEGRIVSSGAHEESRELAVELLGRVGVTEETRRVLAELGAARFRNSERVRTAAARALEAFIERAETSSPKVKKPSVSLPDVKTGRS